MEKLLNKIFLLTLTVTLPFLSFAQMTRPELEEYLQKSMAYYTLLENEVNGELSNVELRTRVGFGGEQFFFYQEFSTVFKDDNVHRYTSSVLAVKPEDIVYQPIESLEVNDPYKNIPNAYQFVRLQLRSGSKIKVGYRYGDVPAIEPNQEIIVGLPFERWAPTLNGEMKETETIVNDVNFFFLPKESYEKKHIEHVSFLSHMLLLVEMAQPSFPYSKAAFLGKWKIDPSYNSENLNQEVAKSLAFHFLEDGGFEESIAGQKRHGKWSISEDSMFINLNFDDGTVMDWNILKFTEDEMNLFSDSGLISLQKEDLSN